jgi:3-hydroxy-9,10-secoandrosta-1,3,5(10)-triene-9,17-dione monooxygenase reductase component
MAGEAQKVGFDARAFRSALGMFATGVAVITARTEGAQHAGLTVNSFSSVSLDPPLVLWSLSLYSASLPLFQHCSHYAINILSANQIDLSQRFATSDNEKFAGLDFSPGVGGAPLLPGCCAWFECRNEARHAGGDHIIFVGLVERFRREDREPLVFQGGRYRKVVPLPAGEGSG